MCADLFLLHAVIYKASRPIRIALATHFWIAAHGLRNTALNEHLQLDSPLQVNDLDIAHPLPSKKGTLVIVKFIHRTQKNEVYRKKRLLKGTKMIITESLTKHRLQLLEKARLEFKQCPVWSWKGEIFVFHNNKKKVIDDFIDITKIKSELSYAQTVKQ